MISEERLTHALRALYEQFGYSRYKMSKFEEYDLYARNKDILPSDGIITFTDTNGKLMALKPDVTLSIIRNSRGLDDLLGKVYYTENVYRVSPSSHAYREILQTGLECLGPVDETSCLEVAALAARSLLLISENSQLALSHPGIVSAAVRAAGLEGEAAETALRLAGEKNRHELEDLCRAAGCAEEAARTLVETAMLSGLPDEVLPRLEALGFAGEETAQLRSIADGLRSLGLGALTRVDLSTECGMRYYSGVVFKGYVSGVPAAVLSGGRYDALLRRMGKPGGAIGFAIYMDRLERLLEESEEYDVDTLLLYGPGDPAGAVCACAERLARGGQRVLAQRAVPEGLRCRRIVRFGESEGIAP